jgi:hypothetical protein
MFKFKGGKGFIPFRNLQRAVTRSQQDRFLQVIKDGNLNDWPDYLIDLVWSSPAATSCMVRRKAFVTGKGFQDPKFGKMMANEDETIDELHKKISSDLSFFGRFAVKIVPSKAGKILGIYHIPIESVRYSLPDSEGNIQYATVNYFYNTEDEMLNKQYHYPLLKMRRKSQNYREDIKKFEIQFPEEEYRGHIYFYNRTNEQNRIYSRPEYTSSISRMAVDGKIGTFYDRNTDNNFFLGAMLSVVGDPDEQLLDEKGVAYTTRGEAFASSLSATFSGADNSGGIWVDWVQNPDEATKVQAWPGTSNHELFNLIDQSNWNVISIAMGIPQVLLGKETPGKLGGNQDISNAISFANENTETHRTSLNEFYTWLASNINGIKVGKDGIKIRKILSFTELQDSILSYLTPNQMQTYLAETYGIEPDTTVQAPTQEQQPQPEQVTPETETAQ